MSETEQWQSYYPIQQEKIAGNKRPYTAPIIKEFYIETEKSFASSVTPTFNANSQDIQSDWEEDNRQTGEFEW